MESTKRKQIEAASLPSLSNSLSLIGGKSTTANNTICDQNAIKAEKETSVKRNLNGLSCSSSVKEPPVSTNKICHNTKAAYTFPLLPQVEVGGETVETGYESDSDLSSSTHVIPEIVHAPLLNRTMVNHTYTDYSLVDEQILDILIDVNSTDSVLDVSTREPFVAADTDEEKKKKKERTHAKKLKKLKKIFSNVGQTRKNSGGVVQPFPMKLMEVLSRADTEDCISWLPHGRAFVVLQSQVFAKEVLPRFFKQSKFMSFTRQLNLWGFKRITKGTDARAYYHELFLRGKPKLCMMMRRQKIKGTGIKLTPNPDTEPNFYKISKDKPLPPPTKKKQHSLPFFENYSAMSGLIRSKLPHELDCVGATSFRSQFSPSSALYDSNAGSTGHASMSEFSQVKQPHIMRYPSLSPQSQFAVAGGRIPSVSNISDSSLLLNHLPVQEAACTSHRNNLLRTMSDHTYQHQYQLNPRRNLPPSSVSPYYPNRQNALNFAAKLHTECEEMRLTSTFLHHRAPFLNEEQRQKTAAVISAQDLLYEVNGILPDSVKAATAGSSVTSVEELKHRLLLAARALETPIRATNADTINGINDEFGGDLHKLSSDSNAASHQRVSSHHEVNVPVLMSVLEQTQKVAAVAQEQSLILQKFAQNFEACHHLGVGGVRGSERERAGAAFESNSNSTH